MRQPSFSSRREASFNEMDFLLRTSSNGEPLQFVTELTIMFDGKKDSAKLKIESDPLSSLNPEPRSPSAILRPY